MSPLAHFFFPTAVAVAVADSALATVVNHTHGNATRYFSRLNPYSYQKSTVWHTIHRHLYRMRPPQIETHFCLQIFLIFSREKIDIDTEFDSQLTITK